MSGRARFAAVLVAAALLAALPGCGRDSPGPGERRAVLSREDSLYLRDQARRVVDSARLASGATSGPTKNATPFDLHVPGGNMGYPAFWVRDAVMMLGGDLIRAEELEGWIRLMAGSLKGPGEWIVRPGVVVPAYAVPDHVNFDGRPTFYPGNYETGDKQGGGAWGKFPPLDDHFYFVMAVYEHWKLAGSLGLFRGETATTFSREPLAALCEKVFGVASVDAETGLVVAGDIKTENAKDWGFCDAESKSGKLLFPSVLRYVAASELSELFGAAGDAAKARRYSETASRIRRSIGPTFFYPSAGGREGWLHSATGVGNQPDVWGSAFAVYSRAVDPGYAGPIAAALVRAFRERTAVRNGWVRHVLTTDPKNGGGWEVSIAAKGTYQNGGYWGVPVGWYVAAIASVDRAAAGGMARDFIRSLRAHARPDGTTDAWEWMNPDTGQSSNPLYAATVALPYLCLKSSGLLDEGR